MPSHANESPPVLQLVGPDGAGKRTLHELRPAGAADARLVSHYQPDASDAYLFLLPGHAISQLEQEEIDALTVHLHALRDQRGSGCAVAGMPVFVVLTKVDLLARPGDSHVAWVERIEAAKQQLSEKLISASIGQPPGFGGLDLHVWATASQRPGGTESFGVSELFQQAGEAARAYRRHCTLQARRTRAVMVLLSMMLAAMVLIAAIWKLPYGTEMVDKSPQEKSKQEREAYLASELRALPVEIRTHLRFPRHVTTAGEIDWQRWAEEARVLRKRIGIVEGVLVNPHLLNGGSELTKFDVLLRQLLGRMTLVGLIEESPSARFPNEAHIEESLACQPLPGEVPHAVAEGLRAAARAARERAMQPVRLQIYKRVLELGNGRETAEAWRMLRDGWLASDAAVKHKDWSSCVMLLERLAGSDAPTDPLVELSMFLNRPTLRLPLAGIRLPLTGHTADSGTYMLTIRHRRGDEKEQVHQVTARRQPGVWNSFLEFELTADAPACIEYQPGDELRAELPVALKNHASGARQQFIWSTPESRSPIFAFDALNHPPRLQDVGEADPARGTIIDGARLHFALPAAWRLPDLLMR
jgi:hypothetical protein